MLSNKPNQPKDGERRFARLAHDADVAHGTYPLPEDGLCLSAFLLLSPPGDPTRILAGRLDPRAPWDVIGALDPRRIQLNSEGWMLPSCHLMYFESPGDAAHRILKEQLGLESLPLGGLQVFSEAYPPRRHPGRELHWDLGFLYRGEVTPNWKPAHPAWTELRFVDPSTTRRNEFTRSHEEVLELAGFRIGP